MIVLERIKKTIYMLLKLIKNDDFENNFMNC